MNITYQDELRPVPQRPPSGDWREVLTGTQWEIVNWGVDTQILLTDAGKVYSREGSYEEVGEPYEYADEFRSWRVEKDVLILFEKMEWELRFPLKPGAFKLRDLKSPKERISLVRIQ
ncbi:MAG: hypothetical protein JNK85_19260 [Verrucomicrobiales bacterium]|nr:hypothetical protein [Verrucomicrobiales bacterium]